MNDIHEITVEEFNRRGLKLVGSSKKSRKKDETKLVKACLAFLRSNGAWAGRFNSGTMGIVGKDGKSRYVKFNDADGCSDILACWPPDGTMLAIECKVGRKKPTEAQENFLMKIDECGGVALVVYSVGELADALKDLGMIE